MNPAQLRLTAIAALAFLAAIQSPAQGIVSPLTLQGLDEPVVRSARSTAMGGATVATCGDAAALFSNPAALSRLGSIEVRAGFS